MKKLLFFILIGFSIQSWSQPVLTKYFIEFTDKGNTPYSLNTPSGFLSQKAIDRRATQAISLDSTDLPVDPAYVAAVSATGADVINRIKWFNGVIIETMDPQVLAAINSLPFVVQSAAVGRFARPRNYRDRDLKSNITFPVDNQFKISSFNYGLSANQIMLHNGHVLHNLGLTGSGIIIAVMDAGFQSVDMLPAFDTLWQNNRIIAAVDFVNPGGNVYTEHQHGEMVLSIMGGYLDGELIGTAPEASYLLLRTEDANSELIIEEYNWAAAAQYADSAGADILNTSLGYTTFDDTTMNHTYASLDGNTNPITIAADMAAAKGMLVVNSAGNEGNSSWNFISSAADGDSVLAVGAVDEFGNYVSFSGKGPTSDGRIKPNVVAQGFQTVVASPGGGILQGNGTSFSGPVIAGLAACLWQAHPGKTNMEIFNVIQESSSQFTSPDNLIGHGIPDFAVANTLLSGIVENLDLEQIVKIYPNPFTEYFAFDLYAVKEQNILINMFDAAGRQILSKIRKVYPYTLNEIRLYENLSFSNGLYIMQVQTKDKVYYQKIIKR
ncbi:MAG: S8 family serine peptidase [Bacteroidia bacterium]